MQYIELHKDKVENDIQFEYSGEIQQVLSLGFQEEFYVCEKHPPFSIILEIDVVWKLSASGAVWRMGPMFSLLIYGVFAIHNDGHAYATVVKDRVKFVTMFEDGTIVHTSSFNRMIRGSVPEQKYIFQASDKGTILDTWLLHQSLVEQIAGQGKAVISLVNMQDATNIEHRIDDIQLHGTSTPWRENNKKREKHTES